MQGFAQFTDLKKMLAKEWVEVINKFPNKAIISKSLTQFSFTNFTPALDHMVVDVNAVWSNLSYFYIYFRNQIAGIYLWCIWLIFLVCFAKIF